MSVVDDAVAVLTAAKGAELSPEEQQAAQVLAGLVMGALDKAAAKAESDAAAPITTLEAAEASAVKR